MEAAYALAIFTLLVFVGGCFFGVWFHPIDEEVIICSKCGISIEPEEEEEGEE